MNEVQLMEPPHSAEAEQSLIGAVLCDNQAFDRVVDLVGPDDFYRDEHRRIWRHLSRLIEAGKPADLVTVSEALVASEDNGKTGGAVYLAQLSQNTPSALNVRRYAELVRERALRRRLAQVATEIAESALKPSAEQARTLIDKAESKIFALGEVSASADDGPVGISTLLSKVYERIDHLHHQDNPSDVTGVPTGFVDLDVKTAGMHPGDLIVVAGRPSMGKTAFALNVGEHVALKCGLPVVVFSMEMSGEQLSQRLLASIAHVDAHKLRTGKLSNEDWSRLTEGMTKLHALPIHIDDGAALTALEVRARARRIRRQHGKLGLVVVDYLQLMASPSRGDNRATEISEISRSLKGLAKELDCPVILLSQLNRAVEARVGRRPMMSDLRESGAIEQDADTILFLYREEVYSPDDEEAKGRAELIIGKQRNGPIGRVHLTYLGRFTRFENFAAPMDFTPKPKGPKRPKNFMDYLAEKPPVPVAPD